MPYYDYLAIFCIKKIYITITSAITVDNYNIIWNLYFFRQKISVHTL